MKGNERKANEELQRKFHTKTSTSKLPRP